MLSCTSLAQPLDLLSFSEAAFLLFLSVLVILFADAALPGQEKVWRLLDNHKVGHVMSKTGRLFMVTDSCLLCILHAYMLCPHVQASPATLC